MKILQSFAAQKFSAYFMARRGLAFYQRDVPSFSSERDCGGTTRHSTTDDENFVLQRLCS
jgi:hypothetical protein